MPAKDHFIYKLLRKYNHTCSICGKEIHEVDAYVSCIYDEKDLLS